MEGHVFSDERFCVVYLL